jgi:rhodanese-related sulfurtransferase
MRIDPNFNSYIHRNVMGNEEGYWVVRGIDGKLYNIIDDISTSEVIVDKKPTSVVNPVKETTAQQPELPKKYKVDPNFNVYVHRHVINNEEGFWIIKGGDGQLLDVVDDITRSEVDEERIPKWGNSTKTPTLQGKVEEETHVPQFCEYCGVHDCGEKHDWMNKTQSHDDPWRFLTYCLICFLIVCTIPVWKYCAIGWNPPSNWMKKRPENLGRYPDGTPLWCGDPDNYPDMVDPNAPERLEEDEDDDGPDGGAAMGGVSGGGDASDD